MINLKNAPVLKGYLKWCKNTGNSPKYEQYLRYFGCFAKSNATPCSRDCFQNLLQRLSSSHHHQEDLIDRFSDSDQYDPGWNSQNIVFRDR